MPKLLRPFTAIFVALFILAGCAGQYAHRQGLDLIAEGRIEEGLEKLQVATRESPTNGEYRLAYLQARDQAIADWIRRSDTGGAAGQRAEAEKYYRRILALDPNNARAREGLAELSREARHAELLAQADSAWAKGDIDTATSRLRALLAENPQYPPAVKLLQALQNKDQPPAEPRLSPAFQKPIAIEFKDVPLKQVFEVFSRTSGLNFIFDKDVRTDQKVTLFIRDSTVLDAVNLILVTQQLEQRILDKNSVMIYPNTPSKARDYQQLSVKSFFLTNAEAKNAANTIKTIVKTRDLVVDERQNMLTMRDTPDAIRLAEKLLALHDLPEPEVMLEVEILEVQRNRLLQLGIQWPDQLTLQPLARPTSSATSSDTPPSFVTLADLKHLPANQVGATLTPMAINAKKQDGDANLLANPRIRTRNRETAKILIGNRLPNITTTSTATGFVMENVQYVDVGLKLEAQPTIYMDREVAIKLSLEVSSIVNTVETKSGTLAYQIGTRNASTVLRLKDGENQILAGLINDEDRSTANKVPLLGEIPLLGRLFGSQRDDNQKTEIVLSITPRLVRSVQRPALSDSEFDSGTEATIKSRTAGTTAGSAPGSARPSGQNPVARPAPAEDDTAAGTPPPAPASTQGTP